MNATQNTTTDLSQQLAAEKRHSAAIQRRHAERERQTAATLTFVQEERRYATERMLTLQDAVEHAVSLLSLPGGRGTAVEREALQVLRDAL